MNEIEPAKFDPHCIRCVLRKRTDEERGATYAFEALCHHGCPSRVEPKRRGRRGH